jgi:hypothetical protein
MNQYRQGDLLIIEVSEFNGNRVIKKWLDNPNEFEVLRGEATGHSHKLKKGVKSVLDVYENESGERFFEVIGSANLVHEEHKTINFTDGKYAIIRQRAYTPKAIEYVID